MTEKNCIIIDDVDQQYEFESNVKRPLRKEGFDVHVIHIRTSSPEVLNDNEDIDIDKLRSKIEEACKNKAIDAIATDFGLSDDNIDGITVVEEIRRVRPNVPIILYSGTLDKVIRRILGDYPQKNERDLISEIKKLIKYNINDFVDRNDYANALKALLKDKKVQTTSLLVQKIREYGDLTFKSCYEPFKGKTLNDIADEIDRQSSQGRDFQGEIMEQVIAYMIKINESDE